MRKNVYYDRIYVTLEGMVKHRQRVADSQGILQGLKGGQALLQLSIVSWVILHCWHVCLLVCVLVMKSMEGEL
jgi:uncharacterized membrane protein